MVVPLIDTDLVDMLKREFPQLWNNAHNREDAIQTLWVVQFTVLREDRPQAARQAMAWLVYELGLEDGRPSYPKPDFQPPGELTQGTFIDELDAALESIRDVA